MFTRRGDNKAGPDIGAAGQEAARPAAGPLQVARPVPAAGGPGPSIVGAQLSIRGNLESRGEVQIDGAVEGDIHAERIVVGQQARITGNLLASDIVVHGAVSGSIRGRKVALQAASRVEGDIFHASLAIERGAYFEGRSRRVEEPGGVPRAANGHSR